MIVYIAYTFYFELIYFIYIIYIYCSKLLQLTINTFIKGTSVIWFCIFYVVKQIIKRNFSYLLK